MHAPVAREGDDLPPLPNVHRSASPVDPLATPPGSPLPSPGENSLPSAAAAVAPAPAATDAKVPRSHSKKGPPLASNTRIWHDRTGQFSVDAEFVGFSGPGGSKLRLHTIQGAIVEIALEELAKSDLKLLEDMTGRALLGPAAYATNLPPPDPAQSKRMHRADVALKSFLAQQDDVVTKAMQGKPPTSSSSGETKRKTSGSTTSPENVMRAATSSRAHERDTKEEKLNVATLDADGEDDDPTLSWAWRSPPDDVPQRTKSTSRNYKARQIAKARGKTWDIHDDPGDMEILEPYQAEMIPTLPEPSDSPMETTTTNRASSLRKRMSFSAAAKAVRRSTLSKESKDSSPSRSLSFRRGREPNSSPSYGPTHVRGPSPRFSVQPAGQTSPARKRRSNSLASPSQRTSSHRTSPPPPLPSSPSVQSIEGRTPTVSASMASPAPVRPGLSTSTASAGSMGLVGAPPMSTTTFESGSAQGWSPATSPLTMASVPASVPAAQAPIADDPVSSFFDMLEIAPPPASKAATVSGSTSPALAPPQAPTPTTSTGYFPPLAASSAASHAHGFPSAQAPPSHGFVPQATTGTTSPSMIPTQITGTSLGASNPMMTVVPAGSLPPSQPVQTTLVPQPQPQTSPYSGPTTEFGRGKSLNPFAPGDAPAAPSTTAVAPNPTSQNAFAPPMSLGPMPTGFSTTNPFLHPSPPASTPLNQWPTTTTGSPATPINTSSSPYFHGYPSPQTGMQPNPSPTNPFPRRSPLTTTTSNVPDQGYFGARPVGSGAAH